MVLSFFFFFNCARSLVLGEEEEEVCNFAVAAGKVSAFVVPGISGFLSIVLGARLVSRGSRKYWFAKKNTCLLCARGVFHPRLGSPLQ